MVPAGPDLSQPCTPPARGMISRFYNESGGLTERGVGGSGGEGCWHDPGDQRAVGGAGEGRGLES